MSQPQAEVFWQIPHCQYLQDDKFLTNVQGGWARLELTKPLLLSFDAYFCFFTLAKSPPRDLQITAYKWWSAYSQRRPTVFGFGVWLQIIFCSLQWLPLTRALKGFFLQFKPAFWWTSINRYHGFSHVGLEKILSTFLEHLEEYVCVSAIFAIFCCRIWHRFMSRLRGERICWGTLQTEKNPSKAHVSGNRCNIKETTLFSLRENGRSPCFPRIYKVIKW